LEANGESDIVREVSAAASSEPPVDVLKAGHHGSKTSTTPAWLDFWRPSETVISVGLHNLYGHPNAEVVARIEASGSALFRTDLDGEAQYKVSQEGGLSRRVKRKRDSTSFSHLE